MFFIFISLFFIAVHYLAYSRIVKRLHVSKKTKDFFSALLLGNLLSIFAYILSRYFVDVPNVLYYFFSLSIGIGFIIFFAWIVYEFIHVVQTKVPFDSAKRDFLKKSTDIGFVSLGAGYVATGALNDETKPKIIRVEVKQQRFEKPYKIAQLSDLHIGGLIDLKFVNECVRLINKEDVDLVVITGDLIDTKIEKNRVVVDALKNLKSKYGTYYVVGNHEYFHGIEDIITYVKSLNIHVLQNSAKKIDKFYIVGLYDIFGHRYGSYEPDVNKAFENISENENTLLLMHQPRGIYELGNIKPSLILSGHTHGGQLWPFGYLVRLAQPYLKGLYKLDNRRDIYVNRGVGFWGPPMRIGAQAEITIMNWS
ncbi:metallophosphoesterase [Sulfurimonas sp.]